MEIRELIEWFELLWAYAQDHGFDFHPKGGDSECFAEIMEILEEVKS